MLQAPSKCDWYDSPLYYDIIFDRGTANEAQFLLDAAHKHGRGTAQKVLEPACGSGRLVAALAEKGCDVCGFDTSQAMLDFARQRLLTGALSANVFVADMASFAVVPETGRFDLAHCLVSTFKYLLEEKDAVAHLTRVAKHLAVGGIYVLGFHLSDYFDWRRSRERWSGQRGRTKVICNIQSWPPQRATRREQVRSRMMITEGKKRHTMETYWQFRTYNAQQVRTLLKKVPLLEHVATYDFEHDIQAPRAFNDEQLDAVLILKRV